MSRFPNMIRKHINAFILLSLSCGIVAAEAENTPAQETTAAAILRPKLLQGRIENQTRLSPVEPALRTGTSVDINTLGKLKKLSPNNQWDRIPDWAAGTFVHKASTTYYSFTYGMKSEDYSVGTHMSKSSESRGWQKDRFGNIWEYSYNDYLTKTECEDSFILSLVKDTELLHVSADKLIMRFVAVKAAVSKYSRRIVKTLQCESIQTYIPYADNVVKINSSIKSFDQDGNPLELNKTLVLEERVLPYKPRDSYRGYNMRALFAEYLTSHGMAMAVPASNKTSR